MFKVQFTVSAARLDKLLEITFDLGLKDPKIEHHRSEQVEKVSSADPVRAADDDIMSLTEKRPQKGSIREKVVVTLEKLEAKHGVGQVTRKMLRERCTKLDVDAQIIYQLMNDGYLVTG